MPQLDDIRLVDLSKSHWPQVRAIYEAGIATGHATFATEPPDWDRFDSTRLSGQRHAALGSEGPVLGWAAASRVSDRLAQRQEGLSPAQRPPRRALLPSQPRT